MEFRLIYEGQLPANGTTKIKHEIRKVFHKQLAELWDKHRVLQLARERVSLTGGLGTFLNKLAQQFGRDGFRFVPLINNTFGMVCELDILFLRRGIPGNLLIPGGDIDNRIKTLLDALRVPVNHSEVVGSPAADEDPFFCVLQDDALVTKLSVTTDRLLTPLESQTGHPENNVFLVIRVVGKAAELLSLGNVTFREVGKYM